MSTVANQTPGTAGACSTALASHRVSWVDSFAGTVIGLAGDGEPALCGHRSGALMQGACFLDVKIVDSEPLDIRVEALIDVAAAYEGAKSAQVALAWSLTRLGVSSLIVGACTDVQLIRQGSAGTIAGSLQADIPGSDILHQPQRIINGCMCIAR